MIGKWQSIWNKRQHEGDTPDLQALIELDGYDSGAGKVDPTDWNAYTRCVAEKMDLKSEDSLYEVGCGSGAFLFSLKEQFGIRDIGGIDYASGLIDVATLAMPAGNWSVGEAIGMSTTPGYTHVISNAVFHYFKLDYAEAVLEKMISKAETSIGIFDVPDLEFREQSERVRRDKLSEAEYEKKYAGLEHTYYDRNWFRKMAENHQLEIEEVENCFPNYAQASFRFGILLKKRR